MPFYWKHKDGRRSKQVYNVRRVARAVIADYIEKNLHKTAEELKSDLDIFENRQSEKWDGYGRHPFTLREHIEDKGRYFPETLYLDGGEEISISNLWGAKNNYQNKWDRLKNKMEGYGYTILEENEEIPSDSHDTFVSQEPPIEVSLLEQFKQIILYGPPGTGKTYRTKTEILPHLLKLGREKINAEQGYRWDIVQFHPSYNYEDFVRGVKVETSDNNIAYETVDRVFGEICKRAEEESDPENNKYVLIIDEINRANVSAVLGELIYALEYRGEEIKTPYAVESDFGLVIPKNLYIIGTMNTADRTIGQIDYAVRRRFAFVHCPPDKSVIKNDKARDIFSEVNAIFDEHISPDYDAADVRIGHSYFLPKPHENLAHKIIYQVTPILWEYVKDGVLLKSAEDDISDIERKFSDIGQDSTDDALRESGEKDPDANEKKNAYYWEKGDRFSINNIGRTVLSIAHDYVKQNPKVTLEELQEWFPDRHKQSKTRGIKSQASGRRRFFEGRGEELSVGGKSAYVTSQWGTKHNKSGAQGSLEDFIEDVNASGYTVRPCYVVNIGEREGKRDWDACREFDFVAVSGKSKAGNDHKMFKEIEEGAIVFACLLEEGSKRNNGFIGMGEVLKKAVPTNRFMVEGIPILECQCKDGRKYSEKYPIAAEHADENDPRCEWMIHVKWKKVFSREEAKGKTRTGVTYGWIPSSIMDDIKEKFEKTE